MVELGSEDLLVLLLASSTIFKEVRRPLNQGLLPGMDLARVDFKPAGQLCNGVLPLERGLQLLQRPVQILPEQEGVAFVLHGLVEPFTDAVGLRAVGCGPGVVYILHSKVKLVGVVLGLPTVLGAPVCQDRQEGYALFIEEGDYPVVEQVCCGDGRLLRVQLGHGHPGCRYL